MFQYVTYKNHQSRTLLSALCVNKSRIDEQWVTSRAWRRLSRDAFVSDLAVSKLFSSIQTIKHVVSFPVICRPKIFFWRLIYYFLSYTARRWTDR